MIGLDHLLNKNCGIIPDAIFIENSKVWKFLKVYKGF